MFRICTCKIGAMGETKQLYRDRNGLGNLIEYHRGSGMRAIIVSRGLGQNYAGDFGFFQLSIQSKAKSSYSELIPAWSSKKISCCWAFEALQNRERKRFGPVLSYEDFGIYQYRPRRGASNE